MDLVRFAVEDGSTIVLTGLTSELVEEDTHEAAPILGPITDFLQAPSTC